MPKKPSTPATTPTSNGLSLEFEKFRIAAEFAPTHIIFTDAEGVILYVNPAAEKITGYSREEMIGNRPSLWGNRMPKEFYDHLWRTVKIQLKPFHGIITNKRKDGELYEAEVWISPVIKQDGTLHGFVGVEMDVSEQQKLTHSLERSQENFRQMTENIDEVLYLADAVVKKIYYISPAFEKIWGISIETFKKNPDIFYSTIHPEDSARVKEFAFGKITDQGKQCEYRIKRADGTERWISQRMFPVFDEKGTLDRLAGIASDVTEKKMAETRLAELDQLKSRFIDVVSHQFRTPLNAIRWNLESLLGAELGGLNDAQRGFTRLTLLMSTEIIRRVGDLLLALDIQEGRAALHKQSTSLESLVTGAMGEARNICQTKQITCVYTPATTNIPPISVDANGIRLVIERLVDNAIAYTKDGGSIEVRLLKNASRVRFEITDTGIGIPVAEQERMFTRFYRASNASSMRPDASGLGLFLARHMITAHQGTIGFVSNEGKGSTFWFELPITN